MQGEAATPKPSYQPVEATADADKARREQIRKDIEAELGAPLDDVRDRLRRSGEFDEYLIGNQWAINAESTKGYYICPENGVAIAKYLRENNLKLTETNLDLAYEELQDSLKTQPSQTEIPAEILLRKTVTRVGPLSQHEATAQRGFSRGIARFQPSRNPS